MTIATPLPIATPFVSSVLSIEKDWIDYNGHLNMAYYSVLFDRSSDEAFNMMGLGRAYVEQRRLTIYSAESHVWYVRELHLGDRMVGSFHLLEHDDKRIRYYQELRHLDGWLAAASEVLSLHIDMAGPKVTPFPADILQNIAATRAAHAQLPMPERAGRGIAIRRR